MNAQTDNEIAREMKAAFGEALPAPDWFVDMKGNHRMMQVELIKPGVGGVGPVVIEIDRLRDPGIREALVRRMADQAKDIEADFHTE